MLSRITSLLTVLTVGGVQASNVQVCNAQKQLYQDFACCAGNGHSVCTSQNASAIESKIDGILEWLSSAPSLPTPQTPTVTYPATLAQVCGIEAVEERSTLNVYPPSGGDSLDYYDNSETVLWKRVVKLDSNGIPTTEVTPLHPVSADGMVFPAFFGACNAAKDSWGTAVGVCTAAQELGVANATTFCDLTDKYAFLFSVVLQLEYIATTLIPENIDFGTAYLSSVLSQRVEFADLAVDFNPLQLSMLGLFTDTVNKMMAIVNEDLCCETCPKLDGNCPLAGLFISVVGPAGFNGHMTGALSNAVSTVVDINSPLQTLIVEDYTSARSGLGITGRYPQYFDLCLASQRMFDYMLQNPYERYPNKLSGALNRMFRCSEPGAQILQAQSTILKWEYEVSAIHLNDKSKCPTPSQVSTILDDVSLIITRSSEFQHGKLSALLDSVFTSPPSVTGTFWIPGNDVYQIQWYWVNFIAVHINVLETECNMVVPFQNPFGFGYKQTYTIRSAYFVTEYARMSGWNSFKESALKYSFVDVPSYAPYDPSVMNSKLLDYNGIEMTPYNDNYVSVRENRRMFTSYSLARRYAESGTLYPTMQPRFDEVYKNCSEYDPTGYVQRFFNLPVPFDEGLSLAWFGVLSNLPLAYTNLTVDGVTKCSPDVHECLMKHCDLRLGATLNPGNDFMPYHGDYATTKMFIGGYYMAPLCLKHNHPATVARCSA